MRNWLRSPTLLKLFVGQHVLNGLSVALGVMAVAALPRRCSASPPASRRRSARFRPASATSRAVAVKARTLLTGFGLAVASTALTLLASPSPTALVVVIGVIAFAAGMVTGYGRWALALSAQLLVPMVVRARPAAGRTGARVSGRAAC